MARFNLSPAQFMVAYKGYYYNWFPGTSPVSDLPLKALDWWVHNEGLWGD